jgi:hypothetical protein
MLQNYGARKIICISILSTTFCLHSLSSCQPKLPVKSQGVSKSEESGLAVAVKGVGSGVNVSEGVLGSGCARVGKTEAVAVAVEVTVGVSEGDGVIVTK